MLICQSAYERMKHTKGNTNAPEFKISFKLSSETARDVDPCVTHHGVPVFII